MIHPTVLVCQLQVVEANRILVEIERQQAAFEAGTMNTLGTSREAVANSLALLKTLRDRNRQ